MQVRINDATFEILQFSGAFEELVFGVKQGGIVYHLGFFVEMRVVRVRPIRLLYIFLEGILFVVGQPLNVNYVGGRARIGER